MAEVNIRIIEKVWAPPLLILFLEEIRQFWFKDQTLLYPADFCHGTVGPSGGHGDTVTFLGSATAAEWLCPAHFAEGKGAHEPFPRDTQGWQRCCAALLWALARSCLWCTRRSSGRAGTKPSMPPSAGLAVQRKCPCHSSLGWPLLASPCPRNTSHCETEGRRRGLV